MMLLLAGEFFISYDFTRWHGTKSVHFLYMYQKPQPQD